MILGGRQGFSQGGHGSDIEADRLELFIAGGGDLLEAAEFFQKAPTADFADAGDLVQFG